MIGKPDWFTTRRYTGIGIRPKTWQGWVYIAVAVAVVIFIRWQSFWAWSIQTKNILTVVWAVVLILDAIHIMYMLNKNKKQ